MVVSYNLFRWRHHVKKANQILQKNLKMSGRLSLAAFHVSPIQNFCMTDNRHANNCTDIRNTLKCRTCFLTKGPMYCVGVAERRL